STNASIWYHLQNDTLELNEEEVFADNIHIGSSMMAVFPSISDNGPVILIALTFAFAADSAYPIVQIQEHTYYDTAGYACGCEYNPPCACHADGDLNTTISYPVTQTQLVYNDGNANKLSNTTDLTEYQMMLFSVPGF
ncbi:unnamed protein product, partial [Meganyctiphanes norvegica]